MHNKQVIIYVQNSFLASIFAQFVVMAYIQ